MELRTKFYIVELTMNDGHKLFAACPDGTKILWSLTRAREYVKIALEEEKDITSGAIYPVYETELYARWLTRKNSRIGRELRLA